MEAKSFSHVVPTRVPTFTTRMDAKKARLSVTMRRITLMMNALNVGAERVRAMLSALGDLVPGTDALTPKLVPHPTLHQWLTGRNEIPLYRAAQIVMILEAAMVEQESDARKIYEPDDPQFMLYATIRKIISELEKDDQLRLLIDRFRLTMRRLLREGVAEKTVEKARAENYAKYLLARGVTAKDAARRTEGEK